MELLKQLILDFTYNSGKTQIDQWFEELKPVLSKKINQIMDQKISYHTKNRKKIDNFLSND